MKILIAGAGGFVGAGLKKFLLACGDEVCEMSRRREAGKIFWDVENGILDPREISGFDAIISLAGENIFGFWTREKKRKILESRVKSARLIAWAISQTPVRPRVFLCASAAGYYGAHPNGEVGESEPAGGGFLARVCAEWEAAARIAEKFGVRVVNMRFGAVLDPSGGMLKIMESAARFKVSAYFGGAGEKISRISLEDLSRAARFCIEKPQLFGAVNFTTPEPITKIELAKLVKESASAWMTLGIPPPIVKLLGGEMAAELLLSDISAPPKKLLAAGFEFASYFGRAK